MAFVAIESIRDAELSAQKSIETAQSNSRQDLELAEKKASDIISQAHEKAKLCIEHKSDKARASADEIIVTAKNSALLEADALKSEAKKKQPEINKKILDIII
ncbi:MAG: hypothetical protein IJC86_03095 [Clostridia bacterium]|nr:hypothetical protein [Clostridia bacterium]